MLCPGLIRLQGDTDKEKSKFIFKNIIVINGTIPIESKITLETIQLGLKEGLPRNHSESINTITEVSKQDRETCLTKL